MGIEYEKELYSRIETLRSELEAEYEKVKKAEAERDRLRQYIAEVHNKVRHELSAEIEAATDKAFRALNGTQVLSLIKQEPTS